MKATATYIEPLEARIAPSTLTVVDPHTATYRDADGDLVTVKVSAGTLDPAGGNFTMLAAGPLGGDLLESFDLLGNQGFKGANITVTAKPQDVNGDGVLDGDGLANVGRINAAGNGGVDLGSVSVKGNVDSIFAGNTTTQGGVKSLLVTSMGLFGTGSGFHTTKSTIQGKLGTLTVTGDIHLFDGADLIKAGSFGAVTVGGDLRGGIESTLNIGAVKIGGTVTGEVVSTTGSIASVTVGGAVIGSTISAKTALGAVKIGGDARFANILTDGTMASVNIVGSLIGGVADGVGRIASGGNMGPVKIGGDVRSLNSNETGKIDAGGNLASLTILGSLIGGTGDENTFTDGSGVLHEGQVFAAGLLGPVKIGGQVVGGDGKASAEIRSHTKVASVFVGGSLTGGAGDGSGQIASEGDMGTVRIVDDVLGGSGNFTGAIRSGGIMASVSVAGKMTGGTGGNTGEILSLKDMGTVFVGGDVTGVGPSSGLIFSAAKLQSVRLGGSLVGGTSNSSGHIHSTGDMGAVVIDGDVRGGSTSSTDPLDSTGYIQGARIASVLIKGSILAGTDAFTAGELTKNASIRADNDIGSITVLGSLVGTGSADPSEPTSTPVILLARGKANLPASNDVAIGKITVLGSVELANILAGYDVNFGAKNADAQIGSVTVFGDWTTSNLLVGVTDAGDGFGNSSDVKISGAGVKDVADNGGAGAISKIASVIIKGNALGTRSAVDFITFGIEAQYLGSIKVGGATVPLLAGAGNDKMGPGNTAGKARPLGASFGTTISDGFDFHAFEVALT